MAAKKTFKIVKGKKVPNFIGQSTAEYVKQYWELNRWDGFAPAIYVIGKEKVIA